MRDAEAESLKALGRELAGQSTWWGSDSGADASESGGATSAIHVRKAESDLWEVRVSDAIGVIRVGDQTLVVQPKIPMGHVLGLLSEAGTLPRTSSAPVQVSAGAHLFDLIASWLLTATQTVLRGDLIKQFQTHREVLPHVRGRINPAQTAGLLLRGRPQVDCEFDDLDIDNPTNRVLRAAVARIARSPLAQSTLRRTATQLLVHFQGVGDLRRGDASAAVTRQTWYYRDALQLANVILAGFALTLREGSLGGSAFLLRTPEAVEAGLRSLLTRGLADECAVTKKGLQLTPSTKTLNPDLVFDNGSAVGDVKYQLQGTDWDTGHIYQATTFATGYRASHALVITFRDGETARPSLQIGDVDVTNICWDARDETPYETAAERVVEDVRDWLPTREPASGHPEALALATG
ncbi:McrC family protein [Nocardioides nanhaiensis]